MSQPPQLPFKGQNLYDHLLEQDAEKAPLEAPAFTGAPTVNGSLLRAHLPINAKSQHYTLVADDAQRCMLHPGTDPEPRTFTIPSNVDVPYPIGTVLNFINFNGGGLLTIAINDDKMRLAGPGTEGSRQLSMNGIAAAIKIGTTTWIISGVNLT